MPRHPLTVYKASAGSGKTFTLAVEYIKLLIEDPTSYRHILAVTFTNKATEEMKMRILSQLYGLSKGYSDSDAYLQKICKELRRDASFVRARAEIALTGIIHHYHYFRVETIDKFFQRVLRNLAHELDLTANLRLELNDYQVEQQAVDQMVSQLQANDNVLQWIMDYIGESISDDRSWNVIGQVKTFGENIFKDSYKDKRDRMELIFSDPGFFDRFRKQLYALKADCQRQLADLGEQFMQHTQGYGKEDFYYGGNGVYGLFSKLRDGTFKYDDYKGLNSHQKESQESSDRWYSSKCSDRAAIVALAESRLMSLLDTTEATCARLVPLMRTVDLTLKHLHQLRLILRIEEKMRELNQESNRFLLSDTQGMLHALIDNSDTPFIYEKTGATLHHIMIDEFQDTGSVQWENFKVLLRDCMDRGSGNLIVGDVKQSIYRWRGGDWRLLNGIEGEFGTSAPAPYVCKLDTNYRSSHNVVTFNNTFFQIVARNEHKRLKDLLGADADQLVSAYSDVVQQIPSNREKAGYVRVDMLPHDTHDSLVMDHIVQTVRTLMAHGVRQDQIAILVRKNDHIADTALYFQEHEPDLRIVSDEAFSLGSSIALHILMTSLRVLTHPDDRLSKVSLAKTYQDVVLRTPHADEDLATLRPDADSGADPIDAWLPTGYTSEGDRRRLMSMPLHDLVETLFTLFGLERLESQTAYICAFYDKLNEFLSDNIGDVDTLLEAWDDDIRKQCIQADSIDGIRMVTIHKSKGLEYDHLIVPFCNWKLEIGKTTLWCTTGEAPFDQLPILPVTFSRKQMTRTLYEDAYMEEHLQNSVDNLNLLYVAFTRAKHSLHVIGQLRETEEEKKAKKAESGKQSEKGKKSTTQTDSKEPSIPEYRCELIEDSLEEVSQELTGQPLLVGEDGTKTLEYGTLGDYGASTVAPKASANVFLQQATGEPFALHTEKAKAVFLQSNQSKSFVADADGQSTNEYIRRGTLLHSIFSRLRDIHDIERTMQALTMDGVIGDEVSASEVGDLLRHALSHPQAREWFDPHWEVHNECSILYRHPSDGHVEECRPDRVVSDERQTIVVDFKFGKPAAEHERQVRRYITHLQQMGDKPVSGYLWYVTQNQVKEVDPS